MTIALHLLSLLAPVPHSPSGCCMAKKVKKEKKDEAVDDFLDALGVDAPQGEKT